jgi:hypothetical protein
MTRVSLLLASLRYYRGVHAIVVAGVAVAVAVMAGALMVGASVRTSLRELALARLGNSARVVASATYFRARLADDLGATPLIAMAGALTHADTRRTAAAVQVYGVDDRFMRFQELPGPSPQSRDIWISRALAQELQAETGDDVILRIAKPTDVPLDTLQGRRDEAGERLRATVTRIATRESLGEFALSPAQGPSRTVFVPLVRLQTDLELSGRINTLLFRSDVTADANALGQHMQPAHRR